jgi:hypothetical protein
MHPAAHAVASPSSPTPLQRFIAFVDAQFVIVSITVSLCLNNANR